MPLSPLLHFAFRAALFNFLRSLLVRHIKGPNLETNGRNASHKQNIFVYLFWNEETTIDKPKLTDASENDLS